MSAGSINFAAFLSFRIMSRRFWQAFTALSEHGYVGYAKLASSIGMSSVDQILTKATSADDLPPPERYVRRLLDVFSVSPPSFRAFSLGFTRRFGTTRSWRVALKCLLLLHRLLRSAPRNSLFRAELIWSRENGLISLHPCRFQDRSSSFPDYYTNFISSYARLLDEAISCVFFDSITEKHRQEEETREVGESIENLEQIQSLIDRVMDCRPVGLAASSFIVKSCMKYIIRDSFHCHTVFHDQIVPLLDNLLRLPHKSCIAAFGVYEKAASQETQLSQFYDWCKDIRVCGYYEYPLIDRIPQMQVRSLKVLLAGMWQLTESSSSETTFLSSESITEDDEGDRSVKQMEIVISTQWEIFDDSEFQRKMGENDDMEWEAMLEASASSSYGSENGTEAMNMQLYNPYALNPFYQPCYIQNYNRFTAGNPTY